MRAMAANAYGEADVLQMMDVPEPEPGPGDVIIEVHATSVNPVDTKLRKGLRKGYSDAFPLILGFDVSGVVARVGSAVERVKEGDVVYASPSVARPGADAEYVAVDARTVSPKPAGIAHAEAAALPLVTITAWEALHKHSRLHSNETVLIQGGAGGVGHIAIQLAKLHGCRVITTAGREQSKGLCAELGADVVIDYSQEDVVRRVSEETGGRGCEVVFDTVGGAVFNQSLDCVAVHGRLVTITPPPEGAPIQKLFMKDASIAQESMPATLIHDTRPETHGQILQTAGEMVEASRLRPHIYRRYPLEQLAEAHRQQETGHTAGKLVVEVKPEGA